uniref:uncharacterized protein LOC120347113 n=1 Tax=Styela clava TaxID=7725 RepID=UPI00193A37AD|nr:uncharacterized protein LOC120347113 [Styela clava]
MHLVCWKNSPVRRKLSALSTRVKNKRFYQEFASLVMYHYSHLGIWYVLKLSILAKNFLRLEDGAWFAKVHWKRQPEIYDIIYYVALCEKDIQAIIIQRGIQKFLDRRRQLRKIRQKAKIIQRWWRRILQCRQCWVKIKKELEDSNRGRTDPQAIILSANVQTQTDEEESVEKINSTRLQLTTVKATLKTIHDGLIYMINSIESREDNRNSMTVAYDDILPIALALQEAVTSLENSGDGDDMPVHHIEKSSS